MDLFEASTEKSSSRPMSDQLRPQSLQDFICSVEFLKVIEPLLASMDKNAFRQNLILWGPPGTGKTSLANVIAKKFGGFFLEINAVSTGAKQLREIGEQARKRRIEFGEQTILFIDEIHRLNKAQQDVLLPFTEKGDFTLIGATTENPGYEINSALISRSKVIQFKPHDDLSLKNIFKRALSKRGLDLDNAFEAEARNALIQFSHGDARKGLNLIEQIFNNFFSENNQQNTRPLSLSQLESLLDNPVLYYDKSKDEHYNCTSAFIKSIRGSDPDAAVYYLARMLQGGEDPIFIARRLVVLASEDIGNCDPKALPLAIAGLQAVQFVGMPEARINLSQITLYLASAPKSNSSYEAIDAAINEVKSSGQLEIPNSLKSAQTKFAKDIGFGQNYQYSHNGKKGFIAQNFLPEKLQGKKFYNPVSRGFEKHIITYLKWVKEGQD